MNIWGIVAFGFLVCFAPLCFLLESALERRSNRGLARHVNLILNREAPFED